MPPPVLVMAPLGRAALAALVAGKQVAMGVDGYYLSSAVLGYLLARMAWKRVPDWIQRDVAVRHLMMGGKNKSLSDDDVTTQAAAAELSNIASVMEKVQALVDSAATTLDGPPVQYLHASLLVYVQLAAQLKALYPQQRNDWYQSAGTDGQSLSFVATTATVEKIATPATAQIQSAIGSNVDLSTPDPVEENHGITSTIMGSSTETTQSESVCEDHSDLVNDASTDGDPNDTPPPPQTTKQSVRNKDSLVALLDDWPVDLRTCLDYATWAYEANAETLQEWLSRDELVMMQHSAGVALPGHVAHYMAVHDAKKLLVVGVRGTSSLEELLTDCCGRAVSYHGSRGRNSSRSSSSRRSRSNGNKSPTNTSMANRCTSANNSADDSGLERIEVRAAQPNEIHLDDDTGAVEISSGHERIWVETQGGPSDRDDDTVRCHEGILICAHRLARKLQRHVRELVVEDEYSLLLCGHSLGAGVASLVAVVLRSQFPELCHITNAVGNTSRKIRVAAFAPPPILDHDSACAASSYTISVVNNSDIVPRCSLVNVAVFCEFLRSVSVRLEERDLAPTGPKTTAALLKKLMHWPEQVRPEDLLLSQDEVNVAMHQAHERVSLRDPDHLYIPGRVLIMYEPWLLHRPMKQDCDDSHDSTFSTTSSRATLQHQFISTDGYAAVLRFFEIDALRMITDHVTASYYESVDVFQACRYRIVKTT